MSSYTTPSPSVQSYVDMSNLFTLKIQEESVVMKNLIRSKVEFFFLGVLTLLILGINLIPKLT